MTCAAELVVRPPLRWATAPDPAVRWFDTLAGLYAYIDEGVLLTGANIYCSLDGGLTWHPAGHHDAPPPTTGLAGELANLITATGVGL